MKNICIILLLWTTGSTVFAQQIERQLVSAGGESGKTPDVLLLWSIGETVVPSLESSALFLNQGFQQVEGVSNISLDIGHALSGLHMRYFPNPVRNTLEVEWTEGNPRMETELFLYDLLGREVNTKNIWGTSGNLTWDLSHLSPGVYQLGIQRGQEMVPVGRVVKR
ncbi:MAG: T9SS type A sorting domain-containing protein [Bacteroidota bacterium]